MASAPAADSVPPALPSGSFGAGGWQPGGEGNYPRLSAEDAVKARKAFRQQLINKYHSIVRAWNDIDKNSDGRLSFFEFCRACQKLGANGSTRQLWDAFDIDRNGHVSFEELDPETAHLFGNLVVCIWGTYGSVDAAWKSCFNPRSKERIPLEDFSQACQKLHFNGDVGLAFESLRADKATTGISRKEFGFLGLWFAPEKKGEPTSPLHASAEIAMCARMAQTPRKELPPVVPGAGGRRVGGRGAASQKELFKSLLLKTYGNFVRAWREGLDRDRNGSLDYREFQRACKDMGYAGSPKQLWSELDESGNGTVSLLELDSGTAGMLERIIECAEKSHGSWERAWAEAMDRRGNDHVDRQSFVEGCRLIGWVGNADRLFELLDLDRVRYLTLQGTLWITGLEEVHEVQLCEEGKHGHRDVRITGGFKKQTRTQARRLDFSMRDGRLRQHRRILGDNGNITNTPLARSKSTPDFGEEPKRGLAKTWSGHDSNQRLAGTWSQNSSQQLNNTWSSVPSHPRIGHAGGGPTRAAPPTPGSAPAKRTPPARRLEDPAGTEPFPKWLGRGARDGKESWPTTPSPGNGGWPGRQLHLVDPVWGGRVDAPLARSVLSAPNLAKWHAGLKLNKPN